MTRAALASAILLAACASPEPCSLQAGSYRAIFTEEIGTCGPVPSTTVLLESDLGPPIQGAGADCVGEVTISDDRCTADFNRTCPLYDDAGREVGAIRFSGITAIVGRREAVGTISHFISDPAGECNSRYHVSWTLDL